MVAFSGYQNLGSRYGSSIDMKGSATALNEALESIMSKRKEAEAQQEHLRLARKLIKDRENEAKKLQREKEDDLLKKLTSAEERDIEFQRQFKKAKSMWSTSDNIICGADTAISTDLGTGVTGANTSEINFDYQGKPQGYLHHTYHNQPIYTGTPDSAWNYGNEFIFGDVGGIGGNSSCEEETYAEEMQEAIKSTKKNNKRKFKL